MRATALLLLLLLGAAAAETPGGSGVDPALRVPGEAPLPRSAGLPSSSGDGGEGVEQEMATVGDAPQQSGASQEYGGEVDSDGDPLSGSAAPSEAASSSSSSSSDEGLPPPGADEPREAEPAQCSEGAAAFLGTHLSPVWAVRKNCAHFLKTYARGDCTKECDHAGRVLQDALARNATLAACVAVDKEYSAMKGALEKALCGVSGVAAVREEPHLDQVFDADGNALSFSGLPGDGVLPGVSLAHARRAPDAPADRIPSVWAEQEYQAGLRRAEEDRKRGEEQAHKLNVRHYACKYSQPCGDDEICKQVELGVHECLPRHPCASHPCNNATEVCISQVHLRCVTTPCPRHACVPRQNFSGTVDAEGREVRDVNHTLLLGKAEPDELGLLPAERSACLGRFGPLRGLEEACDEFVDTEPRERPSTCPEGCAAGLRLFKQLVDGSPATARCARLPHFARYMSRLDSTPCDPETVGVAGVVYGSVKADPIEATRNEPEYLAVGGADMTEQAEYMSEYQGGGGGEAAAGTVLAPASSSGSSGDENSTDADQDGSGDSGEGIVVGAGGGGQGGAGASSSTSSSEGGLELSPEGVRYCRADGAMELGADGKPVYCLPRPPSLRVTGRGRPLYDAGRVPLEFPSRIGWDAKGRVAYPASEDAVRHEAAGGAPGEADEIDFDVVKHAQPPKGAKGKGGVENDEDGEDDLPGLTLDSLDSCAANGTCAAEGTFCSAASNKCLRHGVCVAAADCAAPANRWARTNKCAGSAVCADYACVWQCGAAAPKKGGPLEQLRQQAAGKAGADDAAQFRALFAHKLETLRQAGYKDEERNLRLLVRFRGDVNAVTDYLDGKPVEADDAVNAKTGKAPAGAKEPAVPTKQLDQAQADKKKAIEQAEAAAQQKQQQADDADAAAAAKTKQQQQQEPSKKQEAVEAEPAEPQGTPVDILETGFNPNQ